MRFLTLTASFMAILACAAPAQAANPADSLEAALRVQLQFGGPSTPAAGYGMSLGYRDSAHFASLSRLFELKVDPLHSTATVAGLPIVSHSYQANQSADDAYYAGVPPEKPFYARGWFIGTMAGLAATSAALSSASDAASDEDDTSTNGGGKGGIVCGGSNIGSVSTPDDCAVPCPGPGPNSCIGNAYVAAAFLANALVRDDSWMDTGTGGMGDLGEAP